MTTTTLDKSAEDVAATTSNKPVEVFRHRNISASIFENSTKNGGKFYSVSLQRTYKESDDGEYKHSSSFTRDEIPVARYLLDRAWAFLLDAEAK